MKNYLTTKECALALGVSDAHVRRMILDGLITSEKVGPVHLIHVTEMKKAMARKVTKGPVPKKKG